MADAVSPTLSTSLQLQVLEQLGGIERQIGVVQGQNVVIIQEQQRAAEGRKELYERLRKLEGLSATVERIAPMVERHEKSMDRAAGAMWMGRTLWATGAGAAGATLATLLNWLTGGRIGH